MLVFDHARELIREFKGDAYLHGGGVMNGVGKVVSSLGTRATLVRGTFPQAERFLQIIRRSLDESGVEIVREVKGARPNSPLHDLARITEELRETDPSVLVSFGGGSTIDTVKAAEVLRTLGGKIDGYFGVGKVTEVIKDRGLSLTPHVAIQSAASSAAHLTKYANITDTSTGQKKLIVDDAIVPVRPVFDYDVTHGAPADLTIDGALDGISHSLEVLYGAVGLPHYARAKQIAVAAIRLVVEHLPQAVENPGDTEAREALCLATDLGGYSIMIGGTNGGHLTSFSLVDVLSHGRACALMNPYYTVFFAPAIEGPLKAIGGVYQKAGLIEANVDNLSGRELGVAVAEGMFELARQIGFPTKLSDVPGFREEHIERALSAAKNPQLKMKLQNMPVPLTADMVDEYMRPILEAARDGDLSPIRNV